MHGASKRRRSRSIRGAAIILRAQPRPASRSARLVRDSATGFDQAETILRLS
jgi:hypothetical protein